MSTQTALLTFSIGPVHTFIAQARRVADLWAGSRMLSHLVGEATHVVLNTEGCRMVLPYFETVEATPKTLTNRFVCRVPLHRVEQTAQEMAKAVEDRWEEMVAWTANKMAGHPYNCKTAKAIWTSDPQSKGRRQSDGVIEIAWSWVPEDLGESGDSYARAADQAARQYQASRLFRPFTQRHETGDKCAICGERTALPDGKRNHVRSTWQAIQEAAETVEKTDAAYFRLGQTRLCLVCTTKRFYPKLAEVDREKNRHRYRFVHGSQLSRFAAFEDFAASEERPYFALVAMDGDKLSEILRWDKTRIRGDIQAFHRQLSSRLTQFANSLGGQRSADLRLDDLSFKEPFDKEIPPQLIYAGGEDVLFVCHARDALPLTRAIRQHFLEIVSGLRPYLTEREDLKQITISAAILYAHVKQSAGLLFRDVEDLLNRKAKREAGRDALALRLAKRSGAPLEVAFKWDEAAGDGTKSWLASFLDLVEQLEKRNLSSSSSYDLRTAEETLRQTFNQGATTDKTGQRWFDWLAAQLRRDGLSPGEAESTATLLRPFFQEGKTPALRIARFLGREVA